MMDADELRERASRISWWHTMDLGQGVVTHGVTNPRYDLLPRLGLPTDLTGKAVLDIGAWDGYISFEAERRGASHVVAADSFAWDRTKTGMIANPTGQAGFNLAHEAYNSKVIPCFCDVLDLTPEELGRFEIVLFLGVLYHLRYPLLALELVAAMVGYQGLLILETHVDLIDEEEPMMAFYPGAELNNDPTNWFGPNPACVEAMLRDVGFAQIRRVSFMPSWPGMGRIVYHARR